MLTNFFKLTTICFFCVSYSCVLGAAEQDASDQDIFFWDKLILAGSPDSGPLPPKYISSDDDMFPFDSGDETAAGPTDATNPVSPDKLLDSPQRATAPQILKLSPEKFLLRHEADYEKIKKKIPKLIKYIDDHVKSDSDIQTLKEQKKYGDIFKTLEADSITLMIDTDWKGFLKNWTEQRDTLLEGLNIILRLVTKNLELIKQLKTTAKKDASPAIGLILEPLDDSKKKY